MNELEDQGGEGGARVGWKAVYTIVEVPNREKKLWLRIGTAFPNRDASLNVKLDAMPINGTLHIRDPEPRDERSRGDQGEARGRAGGEGRGLYAKGVA